MGLALSGLSACGKAPTFPTDRVWEVDMAFKACGEYQIIDQGIDKMPLKKWVKDWPLEKCDGVFGFNTQDTPKVMRYVPKIQKYIKENCD